MGGKTSALQAAALLVACVRRGLPVAARYAETALFDRIIWLGEHRELPDTGLSSFGREMISVRRAAGNFRRALASCCWMKLHVPRRREKGGHC